jgi:hypothetical protein
MQYWRPPRGRKEEFEKFGMLENFILCLRAEGKHRRANFQMPEACNVGGRCVVEKRELDKSGNAGGM